MDHDQEPPLEAIQAPPGASSQGYTSQGPSSFDSPSLGAAAPAWKPPAGVWGQRSALRFPERTPRAATVEPVDHDEADAALAAAIAASLASAGPCDATEGSGDGGDEGGGRERASSRRAEGVKILSASPLPALAGLPSPPAAGDGSTQLGAGADDAGGGNGEAALSHPLVATAPGSGSPGGRGSPGRDVAPSAASSDSEQDPDAAQCAICLGRIEQQELAIVPGCSHAFDAVCSAGTRGAPAEPAPPSTCPCCKSPFSSLMVYRQLDGSFADFPRTLPVCLLTRARWFREQLDLAGGLGHHGPDLSGATVVGGGGGLARPRSVPTAHWGDPDLADTTDIAEDDELEAFYYSSAAGRARVTIGNRRFGTGGFVQGGRRSARPVRGGPAPGKPKPPKGLAASPPSAAIAMPGPAKTGGRSPPGSASAAGGALNWGRPPSSGSAIGTSPRASCPLGASPSASCALGASPAGALPPLPSPQGGRWGSGASLAARAAAEEGGDPAANPSSGTASPAAVGSTPPGALQGRRARRNARRVQQDLAREEFDSLTVGV